MRATVADNATKDDTKHGTDGTRTRWLARLVRDRANGCALFCSLLLAILYAHITVMHFTEGIAGGKYNGYENLWNDYWLRTALLHLHQNPFFTTYVEYPNGVSLHFHTLNPLGGLIALPLWPLIGPIAAMNVKFLLSLVGSTFFAYLLIRDLTQRPFAAFAGAVVYTYANTFMVQYYTTAEENYIMAAALLPLYIFFLLRAAGRERWRWDAIGAITALFALCLTDWQYTLFAVIFTALYFLYIAAVSRSPRTTLRLLVRFAAIGGVWAAAIFFPLILPMIREAQSSPWLESGDEATIYSRSLWHFFALGADNPGYLVLAITLIGLYRILRRPDAARERQTVLFWLCLAIFGLVMALGPRLELQPFEPTRVPMLYVLVTKVPVLNISRKPHEFYASLAMLAIGVLFAFAVRACIPPVRRFLGRVVGARPRLRWAERVGAPALVVIVLAITLTPFFVAANTPEVHYLNPPSFYRDVLAKDPEQYAILELPIFPSKRGQYGGTYQAFQIVHGKYRFGASISRDHNNLNPDLFARHATLFRDFYWLEDTTSIEQYRPTKRPDFLATPDYRQIGVPMLNYYRVRYIVLYLDALLDQRKIDSPNPQLVLDAAERQVHQVLGADARPISQDALTEIYRVPDVPPLAQPVFIDTGDNGWYAPEISPDKIPYRWADTRDGKVAELNLFNLSTETRRMRVQFTVFNYKAPRTVALAFNGKAADHFTLAADGERDETLDLDIPPGMSRLTLSSSEAPILVQADPKFGRDLRELSFGVRQVRLVPSG